MTISTGLALASLSCGLVAVTTSATVAGDAQVPAALKACSILSKEEVKKHVPWNAVADSIPPDETPVGATGTACQYPSVLIRLLPRGKQTGPPIQGATWRRSAVWATRRSFAAIATAMPSSVCEPAATP